MNKMAILRKTIYERRISTLLWFVTIVFFVVLTMLLFPALKESLGKSLQDVPDSVKSFLGDAQNYQTISGYVDLQVINQMVFFTIIMAVIIGVALIAGEEKSGLLHTQLARPRTRAALYWQKAAALALLTAIVSWAGIFLSIVLGAVLLGELDNLALGNAFLASGMTWLLTMFFASLAFALGAGTGKRGVAGVTAGLYAFLAYMLTALSQLAESLETLNNVSIFKYFNTPSVMANGLDWGNVGVLFILISFLLILGFLRFRTRDLMNR